jgi:hypothetical protein
VDAGSLPFYWITQSQYCLLLVMGEAKDAKDLGHVCSRDSELTSEGGTGGYLTAGQEDLPLPGQGDGISVSVSSRALAAEFDERSPE